MEIEAKLLNPGEAKVEMKMVANLSEWCRLKEILAASHTYCPPADKLVAQIRETAEKLRTVVSGENTDEPSDSKLIAQLNTVVSSENTDG